MTSSALYRYFESRDQLLDFLARDGFASLADFLEDAERRESSPGGSAFLGIARAYRQWCLSHPTEYQLMFVGPRPGKDHDESPTEAEMARGIAVLFRCMIAGLEDGSVQPPPLSHPGGRKLRSKLKKWKELAPPELTVEALAACMVTWTRLHGAISLELFGHLPDPLTPADELFEHLMGETLRSIGAGDP